MTCADASGTTSVMRDDDDEERRVVVSVSVDEETSSAEAAGAVATHTNSSVIVVVSCTTSHTHRAPLVVIAFVFHDPLVLTSLARWRMTAHGGGKKGSTMMVHGIKYQSHFVTLFTNDCGGGCAARAMDRGINRGENE